MSMLRMGMAVLAPPIGVIHEELNVLPESI